MPATRRTGWFRIAVGALVVAAPCALGTPGANASSSRVRVDVRASDDGSVRLRDGAAVVDIRVRCSTDSTVEIDAVLEQRVTGLRVPRSLTTLCTSSWHRVELVFETPGRRFHAGTARLHADAMAGFGEQFGQAHVAARAHLVDGRRR